MIMPKVTMDETGTVDKVTSTDWVISRTGIVNVLCHPEAELAITITQVGDSEGMPPPDWDGIHLMLAVACGRVYTATHPIRYDTDEELSDSVNEGIKKLWDQTPYK